MPKTFTFEVHTPYRLFFTGKVEFFIVTLIDGEICVYANHSRFTAPTQTCILRIKDENGVSRPAFVTDGILEMKEFKTILIVDSAEWPEEIDTERALAAKQKALDIISTAKQKFEIENAKANLRRAEYRLKAAELK
jgi:F-type H+-transporting ATPase subunit epsilon